MRAQYRTAKHVSSASALDGRTDPGYFPFVMMCWRTSPSFSLADNFQESLIFHRPDFFTDQHTRRSTRFDLRRDYTPVVEPLHPGTPSEQILYILPFCLRHLTAQIDIDLAR